MLLRFLYSKNLKPELSILTVVNNKIVGNFISNKFIVRSSLKNSKNIYLMEKNENFSLLNRDHIIIPRKLKNNNSIGVDFFINTYSYRINNSFKFNYFLIYDRVLNQDIQSLIIALQHNFEQLNMRHLILILLKAHLICYSGFLIGNILKNEQFWKSYFKVILARLNKMEPAIKRRKMLHYLTTSYTQKNIIYSINCKTVDRILINKAKQLNQKI